MIRLCILGTRYDGERMARRFGINHIGFDNPGPDEGVGLSEVIGVTDDQYLDCVEVWFNADPPTGVGPGSLLWFKNQVAPFPADQMKDMRQ